jgi:hypothetical protein
VSVGTHGGKIEPTPPSRHWSPWYTLAKLHASEAPLNCAPIGGNGDGGGIGGAGGPPGKGGGGGAIRPETLKEVRSPLRFSEQCLAQ